MLCPQQPGNVEFQSMYSHPKGVDFMARILVIDDDESLLQMMSLMLKRAGHQSILASNGNEGIELARRELPDAALVDVMMPELSGYEVCRILREDPRTQDIPLLILTALSQREHRAQAEDSGADDFVTKPVTRDDLVTHVEELLRTGARNTPAPLEAPPPSPAEEPFAPPKGIRPLTPPSQPTTQPAAYQPAAPAAGYTPPAMPTGVPLIAVVGLASGVGVTTLAVNLALGVMQFGRSCIVDLHQQAGQVAVQLKLIPPRSTWVDLATLTEQMDKRKIGGTLMMDHAAGVAVLGAPLGPTRSRLSGEALQYIFSVLSEGFRRIVADVPTAFDDMTLATLYNASHVVLVVGDNPADVTTIPDVYHAIQDLRLPAVQHIVINRTRPSGVSHDVVMHALNHPITADIPYEISQVDALNQGTPLVMLRPDSLFSKTILHLSRQL
jgi:CheY-like chemotaxis protein